MSVQWSNRFGHDPALNVSADDGGGGGAVLSNATDDDMFI